MVLILELQQFCAMCVDSKPCYKNSVTKLISFYMIICTVTLTMALFACGPHY